MDIDGLDRPQLPKAMIEISGRNLFMPAPEIMAWIDAAYLNEEGPLYTPDHEHLPQGEIACLWTNAENSRQGRRIVGQAEMPANAGRMGNKWAKARAEFQLEEWFGYMPEFLLTFDALYCSTIDNASFCALVDHELYHCAQDTDRFGAPAFNQETGKPKYCIRGHDVEEFVGVVRRFGIETVADGVDFVMAAAQKPEIAPAMLSLSCGTCLRLAA